MSVDTNRGTVLDVNPRYRLSRRMIKKKGRPATTPMGQRPAWAQRLVNAREAAGLSQQQLAIEAGIPQTTIAGYETGAAEPDISALRLLATTLGADPGWIAFGDPDQTDAPLGAVLDRYQKDEAFILTFFRLAAMLGEEGFNADLHFTVRVALRIAQQVKSGADVINLRERVDAAITAERKALREEVNSVKQKRVKPSISFDTNG